MERRYFVLARRARKHRRCGLLGEPRPVAGDVRRKIFGNAGCASSRSTCQGGAQLGAALNEFGVDIVKRPADLTIVLVGDYLDDSWRTLNRRHLSDCTPWVLAQPSGIFPLVGPAFQPGKSACWACLAERMKRNREIKAFLDRAAARPVATSPLDRKYARAGAVQLAAVEIAKAIATGGRTELRDHVISLDLLGSSPPGITSATRPQCPCAGPRSCATHGAPRFRSRSAPAASYVMTSGGYRMCRRGRRWRGFASM